MAAQIAGVAIDGTAVYVASVGLVAYGVETNNYEFIDIGIELAGWIPVGQAVGALVGGNIPAIKTFVALLAGTVIYSARTPKGMADMSAVLGGDPHAPDTPAGWAMFVGTEVMDWSISVFWVEQSDILEDQFEEQGWSAPWKW